MVCLLFARQELSRGHTKHFRKKRGDTDESLSPPRKSSIKVPKSQSLDQIFEYETSIFTQNSELCSNSEESVDQELSFSETLEDEDSFTTSCNIEDISVNVTSQ